MEIELMREEDLDQVSFLEKETFANPWGREEIWKACCQSQNIYLTARENSVVTGYCGIWCSMEQADLCQIAVAPEWRRQGVASALLKRAVEECRCRQVKQLLLEVRMSNAAAVCLYEKEHFDTIYIRKGYYKNPVEDARIMQLDLQ